VGQPKISKPIFQPFEGGVAFEDMLAATTSGIAATRANNCAKYAVRSSQLTCEFWCTGIPTDIVLCGSYPRFARISRTNPFMAAPAEVSNSSVNAI